MQDNQSLRKKTISGALWKFCERVLSQVVNFIVSIILARLLLPEDYGIIALVSVFIAICDKLAVSGFATSLIQKKDADNLDFSTVFFFSLGMSLLLYALLFFGAPLIADFYSAYDRELLIAVIRVMGIQVIVTAILSVQSAYISNTMQFRKTLPSTLTASILSAAVGIWMAYAGYGVWALVAQSGLNLFTIMMVLWFTVQWRPNFAFSTTRFKSLFSYGWKIFTASIIKVLYNDLRSLVIGKFYTSADLAYYNKGQSFPQLIETNVSGTIESVLFPAISKRQTSKEDMLAILRRAIKTSTFILMPLLAGLAAVAEPLISILLTDKWLPSAPFMQVICFTFMMMPIEIDNLQAIKAMGRSDIALKLEIIKKIIGVFLLIVSIPFGVMAIAISMLLGAIINAVVDAVPNKRLLGYGVGRQFLDVLPSLLMSAVMFACVYPLSALPLGHMPVLAIQIVVGVVVYVLLSLMSKNESMRYILTIIKNARKKKK
jgi:O-antigen/teichoic acid export membrane protein